MRLRRGLLLAVVVLSGCLDLSPLDRRFPGTPESPGLPSGFVEDTLAEDSTGFPESPDVTLPDLEIDFAALGEFELAVVEPDSGPVTGGEIVMLVGAGFLPDMDVFFGEMKALDPFVVNGNYATVEIPPHAPGPVDVSSIGDGRKSVLEAGFTYLAPLEVVSVEPDEGDSAGGYPVVVTGSGFDSTCSLFFAGRKAAWIQLEDSYTIVGSAPEGNCGPADVSVVCASGFAGLKDGFMYLGLPRVDKIDPVAGPASGGFTVRLLGRNFTPHMTVEVDGVGLPPFGLDFKAPTMVEFPAPAGAAGVHSLHLATECGETTVEAALLYADPVAGEGDPVSVVGVVPESLPACAGGLATLAIDPPEESGAIQVLFGEIEAKLIGVDEDSGIVDVEVPAPGVAGFVDVTVKTGAGTAVLPDGFLFSDEPVILKVSPSAGSVSGGTDVTIHGCGLPLDAEVAFGPYPGTGGAGSSTEVHAVTPPGSPGPVDVVVAGESGSVVAPGGFTYLPAEPALFLLDPNYGSVSGGTWVRFHGAGVPANAMPFLGDKECFQVQYIDSTLIVARAPAGAAGTVDARLVWPGGDVVAVQAYTYFDPTNKKGGTWGASIDESLNVTVLDSGTGKGLAGAVVIIGDDPATPHQGFTDEYGRITFSLPGLDGPQGITAAKPGYNMYSVVHFDAENVTVYLNPMVVGEGGSSYVPPEAFVGGRVYGFDKYVVIPPGKCMWTGVNGDLCRPCAGDPDCNTAPDSADWHCADLGGAVEPFCTKPCKVPEDCPEGFLCAKTSFKVNGCIPKGGEPSVRCESSKSSMFGYPPEPGPGGTVNPHDIYFISTATGEIAVVCWGGYTDPVNSQFVPTVMGLHRNIIVLNGDVLKDQDVFLDIPLSSEGRIAFHDLPFHPNGIRQPYVMVSIELGKDGFINPPRSPEWVPEGGYFYLSPLPETMVGPLMGATYSIYSSIQSNTPTSIPYAVRMVTEVENLSGDGAVVVGPSGASRLHPPVDGDIVGVVYGGAGDVFVASDKGGLVHFDGVGWTTAAPEGASDEGLTVLIRDDDGRLWAGGKEGSLWRHDGLAWKHVETGFSGPVQDIWAAKGKAAVILSGKLLLVDDQGGVSNLGTPPGYALRKVWGSDFEDLWVVSDKSTVWNRSTDGWAAVATQQGYELEDVDGSGPDDVWIAGSPGLVLRWDGDAFVPYHIDQYRRVTAIVVSQGNKVFAAGEDGLLASFNGSSFDIIPTDTYQDFSCVDYSATDSTVVAAGYQAYYMGPFMAYPRLVQPEADKPFDFSAIEWGYWSAEAHADYHFIILSGEDGYPFWYLVVDGEVTKVLLPSMVKVLGINLIPDGTRRINLTSSLAPDFSIDHYTQSEFSIFKKISWAVDYKSFK